MTMADTTNWAVYSDSMAQGKTREQDNTQGYVVPFKVYLASNI